MPRASKRRRSEIVDTINAALEIVDEVAQDGDGEFVRAVVAGFALKGAGDGTPRSAASCSGSPTLGCQMSSGGSTDTNLSPPAGSSNVATLASHADSTTSSPIRASDPPHSPTCTSYERTA